MGLLSTICAGTTWRTEEGEGAFDVREIAGYDPSRSVASNLLGMIAAGAIGETGVLESEGGSPDLRPTEK